MCLAAAEAVAIHAIGGGDPGAARRRIVDVGLIGGAFAVFALIAIPRAQEVQWLRGQRALNSVLLLAYGAALLLAVVVAGS